MSGWPLVAVEVALAAVEQLAGSGMPPQEIAIREFLERSPDEALALFEPLLSRGRLTATEQARLPPSVGPQVARLLDLGVLGSAEGTLTLAARWSALARELVDPPVMRGWRLVEQAREHLEREQLSPAAALAYLEAALGLTRAQAQRQLALFGRPPR
jgi:hypothetical protein